MSTTNPLTNMKRIIGAGYKPDTTLYAGGTDPNAVAAQGLDRQLSAYQTALQSAYDAQAAANAAEAAKLRNQYNASRSAVYTNNRLSAIGNNERLAALGLAGNIYDHARSGTSETSRIGQDIAMRKSLAGLDQSENEARSDLALALLQAQKEADINYANKAAEIEAAKVPYLTALANAAAIGSGRSGGGSGSRYYTPTTGTKKSTAKTEPSTNNTATGSMTSVHNAIVSNQKNGYAAARQAAVAELAKVPEKDRTKAAEHANKLLNQFKTTR